MKRLVNPMLLAVLVVTTLTLTAAAESAGPRSDAPQPKLINAVYLPSQSTAKFTQVDWDDHRRCDGDHDRDDRHCRWLDREGERYYYRGNAYVGYGYYSRPSYNAYYGPGGWYDKHGRWHTENGWYDKHGKWHKANDHDDR